MTLDESYDKCLELTRSHYENFPVARLIPKRLRKHVAAVYAFARTADDIADEGYGLAENTPESRIAALKRLDTQVLAAAEGRPLDPDTAWIFTALGDTLRRFDILAQLCLDLTSAFAQDVTKRRYETFAEVLDYCRRSANPVGRLVLLLHGLKDDVMFRESDAICTGLQLANFWQDISVDRKKDGRTYLPLEDLKKFGVSLADLDRREATAATRECIRFNVERAQDLFDSGKKLPDRLPFPLSLEIRVTWLGGAAILKKIRRQDCDSVRSRPKIGKADKVRAAFRADGGVRVEGQRSRRSVGRIFLKRICKDHKAARGLRLFVFFVHASRFSLRRRIAAALNRLANPDLLSSFPAANPPSRFSQSWPSKSKSPPRANPSPAVSSPNGASPTAPSSPKANPSLISKPTR